MKLNPTRVPKIVKYHHKGRGNNGYNHDNGFVAFGYRLTARMEKEKKEKES
jgi:hypothetical protein